jgi:hypothetical protein
MSVAPILPVLLCLLVHNWYYMEFIAWAWLSYFQYYSIYWFTTGTTWSLLHGPRCDTVNTTPSTGLRLVLHRVYCMDLAPILPVLLCLLVHDRYYMEFTAWTSLPYFQYYSVYWFMLVLCGVYCMGIAPILPILLHLLVHDWYCVEFTAWALLPYFQYYSIYWCRIYCMGLAPILSVTLKLLVSD